MKPTEFYHTEPQPAALQLLQGLAICMPAMSTGYAVRTGIHPPRPLQVAEVCSALQALQVIAYICVAGS